MHLLDPIKCYYEEKLTQHGTTARGVDWNGVASQRMRFQSLCQVIDRELGETFTIDDYGCGYGACLGYIKERGWKPDYLGLDISDKMVVAGKEQYPEGTFIVANTSPRVADFAVASGIFNVVLDVDRDDWLGYIVDTLDAIHAATTHGFSFNCLTSYSDELLMRPNLYYGDPCFFFDHCKRRYSKNVSLLHDYGLYEFTIIVRK